MIQIMPILWDQYTYPKHQPLPKGYIEDRNWAHDHMGEFVEKYPNQWVAVYNKEVVSVGTDLGEVEKEADKKAVDRPAFCVFAWRVFWFRDKTRIRDKD